MKKELLELVRERLIKIEDTKKQVDILQYMIDIEFFNSKVGNYKCLSSRVPEKLGNNQSEESLNGLSKSSLNTTCDMDTIKKLYSIDEYIYTLKNSCKIIDDVFDGSNNENSINKCDMFADHIINNMGKSDILFDAGIALFHDDKQIQEAAKQYKISRN